MPDAPIFVVEDDAAQLAVLAAMLGGSSHPLRCAMTGSYALDALRTGVPALIICDMALPDMSGDRLYATFGAMSATRVILISGSPKNVPDGELADRVLIKPADLLKAVQEVLA